MHYTPNGLYRPTMDSSTSFQANQPYSPLNRSAHSSGYGSAPVEDDDDSPVEEMSPVKAKKPSKCASKAKKNDTKEKEPPKD
nr:hypothetical protein [Tanacetum cinerariifolium]